MTRRFGTALVLGLLVAILPALHAEPVSAASGVDDYPARLKNAPQDSLVDPWEFYNRECTSWVAWRLNSENGVAFNDYWLGVHWGNASNWKNAATKLGIPVDNNPTRGAVAWWAAGSAGSSRGHVAWVETVGDGAITIEEYNYLREGFYDTRTISNTSSMWPSGFIHIKDTVVRNTVAPAVTGTPQVGVRLVTTHGSWSATHLTFHYQWLANGTPISGATAKAFTPTADQLGKHLQAQVTATKSGAHSGTAKTAATDTVAHGVFTTGTPPVISGTPQVGVPLSTTTGSWQPAPTLSYQWLANGQPIAGATASTFTPTADQLAAVLKVRVTAQAVGYRTKRMASVVTGAVAPGQFVMTTGPSISGTPQVDKPLTASPGTWSPTAKISYQWLADGQPITGATKSTYTPNAADLRKQMTLQVTATQLGYAPSTATSAATDPVAPGTFLNTQQPAIEGTPQVGVELRAGHGTWTPAATFQYQWLVGGLPVPNATDRTFTPRPQDVGKQVALQLTASRPGYLTAVVQTPDSAEILPGIITSLKAPEITGVPMVGHTLQASTGEWSVTPENLSYQWYAGSKRIDGATGSSYEPTADVAGQHVHVTVTASAFGYESESASAARTTKVMLGQIAFGRPTVTGQAVIGRTLTAHITDLNPSTATPYYRWYRGDQVIHGARSATYVLQPEDLGHRVHVVVTERASNWVSTTRSSAPVRGIQTRPTVQATATIVNGRVQLDVSVTAPGLTAPYGIAHARVGNRRVGKLDVRQGHGSGLLKSLAKGRHTITVMYDGYGHQTSARTRVTVTVP